MKRFSPYHPLIVIAVISAGIGLKYFSLGIFTLLFGILGIAVSLLFGVAMIGSWKHGVPDSLGWLASSFFLIAFGAVGDTDTHRSLTGFGELLRYTTGVTPEVPWPYTWLIAGISLFMLAVVLVRIGLLRDRSRQDIGGSDSLAVRGLSDKP